MTIQLNTGMLNNIFSGTYGTIWEEAVTDYDDDGNELDIEYNQKDFMQSILEAYQDHSQEIDNEINIDWINSISFTGHYSPREYNYSNDQLDITLDIDKNKIIASLGKVSQLDDFKQFLTDNYRSRDGFISFTPYKTDELINEIVSDGKYHDQAISAFINYLTQNSLEVEHIVFEAYISNGFYGLNYKVIKS